tara:strand:+ start:161 stop:466 length:306 start_codon:yes stop_codon:yes gene_type:complete
MIIKKIADFFENIVSILLILTIGLTVLVAIVFAQQSVAMGLYALLVGALFIFFIFGIITIFLDIRTELVAIRKKLIGELPPPSSANDNNDSKWGALDTKDE